MLKQRAMLMSKLENLVFIAVSSNKGSCGPVQMCRLSRAFTAHIHKVRCTCADPESFVRGVQPDKVFFCFVFVD